MTEENIQRARKWFYWFIDKASWLVLLVLVVYWVVAVTLPYYLQGLNRVEQSVLMGPDADPEYFYENIMGRFLWETSCIVWFFFYTKLGLVPFWIGAAVGFVRTRKPVVMASLLASLFMYVHLVPMFLDSGRLDEWPYIRYEVYWVLRFLLD